MAQKTYAGIVVEVNDEGYFTDPAQWKKEMAMEIAKEEGIELTCESPVLVFGASSIHACLF